MAEDMSDIINQITKMMGNTNNNSSNTTNNSGNSNNSQASNSFNNTNNNSGSINNDDFVNNLKNILGNLNNNSDNSSKNTSSSNDNNNFNFDIDTMLKMKSIMEKMNSRDDPRSNLLMSLKPYLNERRRGKLDQYVKLLNMSKIVDVFNSSGGQGK